MEGTKISDIKTISNSFNDFFSTIGKNISEKISNKRFIKQNFLV